MERPFLTTEDLAILVSILVAQKLGATLLLLQLAVATVVGSTAPVTDEKTLLELPPHSSREPGWSRPLDLDLEFAIVQSTVLNALATFSGQDFLGLCEDEAPALPLQLPSPMGVTGGQKEGRAGWPHRSVASLGDPLPPKPQ